MSIDAYVFDAYGTLYDVQSVSQITDIEYPDHGELITQVWRLKQLEYTWLRTLMKSYRSFWDISEESLIFTLDALGLKADRNTISRIMDKYLHLDPYPDAIEALKSLQGVPLGILSNGNQEILDLLVRNTGLDTYLNAVISIDAGGNFKPHPSAYELVQKQLGVPPEKVMFVSSNAFDATAAKNFGFQVAWIERVTPSTLAAEISASDTVGPTTMFKILRMQMENFDMQPDHKLNSLADLQSITA